MLGYGICCCNAVIGMGTPICSLTIVQGSNESSSVQGCGQHDYTAGICSPNSGVWMKGTEQNITWNPKHSVYVNLKRVNITVSCMVDFQPRIMKSWDNVPVQNGSLPVYIDSTYFPEAIEEGIRSKSWGAFVNISSNELAYDTKASYPSPASVTLLEITADPSSPTFELSHWDCNSTRPPSPKVEFDNTWLIGIAAILATGVLLCLVLAVWCYMRPASYRVGQDQETEAAKGSEIQSKEESITPSDYSAASESCYPSQFTQFSYIFSDDSMDPSSQPTTEIQLVSESPGPRAFHTDFGSNMKALSSTDAFLLGNMFRQKMPRPDWATDSQVTDMDTGVEQPAFGNNLKKQLLEQNVQRIDK